MDCSMKESPSSQRCQSEQRADQNLKRKEMSRATLKECETDCRQQVREFFHQPISRGDSEPQDFKLMSFVTANEVAETPAKIDPPSILAAAGGPYRHTESNQVADSNEYDMIDNLERERLGSKDPYITVGRLGSGGNGACFVVRVRNTKVLRACKVIATHADRLGLPTKEERVFWLLPRHKNIPTFYGAGCTGCQRQIFMELCPVGDLGNLIAQSVSKGTMFCEAFVWHCVLQLASATAFIHFGFDAQHQRMLPAQDGKPWRQIIHGDIKPKNIFVRPHTKDESLDLVLGDFGNAEFQPGRGNIGTPMWAPPEAPDYSSKSDVWGVGAVLWALCKGGRPPVKWELDSHNEHQWGCLHFEQGPTAPLVFPLSPTYSPELSLCLLDALTYDPTKRPLSIMLYGSMSAAIKRRDQGPVFST